SSGVDEAGPHRLRSVVDHAEGNEDGAAECRHLNIGQSPHGGSFLLVYGGPKQKVPDTEDFPEVTVVMFGLYRMMKGMKLRTYQNTVERAEAPANLAVLDGSLEILKQKDRKPVRRLPGKHAERNKEHHILNEVFDRMIPVAGQESGVLLRMMSA